MLKSISYFYLVLRKIYKVLCMAILKPLFKKHGTNFVFDPFGYYVYKNISVGHDVYIGPGANFGGDSIFIGNKVLFGPNVSIHGGDHSYTTVGKYIFDCTEGGLAAEVIIEDDVWIGSGVIILKGVKIGRGSIVAAGAVVTKSINPYSIVAGVPAAFVKMRFTPEQIIQHEKILFNEK